MHTKPSAPISKQNPKYAWAQAGSARKLDDYAGKLQEAYPKPGLLRRKDTEAVIHGVALQLYKASAR